jgi:hypothetical protein
MHFVDPGGEIKTSITAYNVCSRILSEVPLCVGLNDSLCIGIVPQAETAYSSVPEFANLTAVGGLQVISAHTNARRLLHTPVQKEEFKEARVRL